MGGPYAPNIKQFIIVDVFWLYMKPPDYEKWIPFIVRIMTVQVFLKSVIFVILVSKLGLEASLKLPEAALMVPDRSQIDPRSIPDRSQISPRSVPDRSQIDLRSVPYRSPIDCFFCFFVSLGILNMSNFQQKKTIHFS